jgi:hypothetical protein
MGYAAFKAPSRENQQSQARWCDESIIALDVSGFVGDVRWCMLGQPLVWSLPTSIGECPASCLSNRAVEAGPLNAREKTVLLENSYGDAVIPHDLKQRLSAELEIR